MNRIDVPSASPTLPTPDPAGTPGYFTKGNPLTAVAATIVDQDFMNSLQEELLAVILAAGITPSKTNNAQVLAALFTIHGSQVFTNSGTFTPPAGVTKVRARCWGAGGGAGGVKWTSVFASSVGGGGGGYSEGMFAVSSPVLVTVGTGGTAGTGAPTNGGAGGLSSFGAFAIATGGGGGLAGNNVVAATPSSGGTGSGGSFNVGGTAGTGSGVAGGPAGSAFGGVGAPGGSANGPGPPGNTPGGGGGGTSASVGGQAGGGGGGGLVIVDW